MADKHRKRQLLRSRDGCDTCKTRKKKCDEVKPICGGCNRLGLKCQWSESLPERSSQALIRVGQTNQGFEPLSTEIERKPKTSKVVPPNDQRPLQSSLQSFDHPSVLRGSPTSAILPRRTEKDIMQFLLEIGGEAVLRFPTRQMQVTKALNVYTIGFQVLSHSSATLHVWLALGARQLSKANKAFQKLSHLYYTKSLMTLRSDLKTRDQCSGPSDWAITVAANLALCDVRMHSCLRRQQRKAHLFNEQMTTFEEPETHMAHFVGFLRLVEARIDLGPAMSTMRVTYEFYVHCISDGALFHFEQFVGSKTMGFVEENVSNLNHLGRLFGKTIVGVPDELTIAAYKLAFLNRADVFEPPWDVELLAVRQVVFGGRRTCPKSNDSKLGLQLIENLYRLACSCLLLKIENKNLSHDDTAVREFTNEAADIVLECSLKQRPYISSGWPLTVLAMFAVDKDTRDVLLDMIKAIKHENKLEGYQSVLDFISCIWMLDLGPDALDYPELLSMVHL